MVNVMGGSRAVNRASAQVVPSSKKYLASGMPTREQTVINSTHRTGLTKTEQQSIKANLRDKLSGTSCPLLPCDSPNSLHTTSQHRQRAIGYNNKTSLLTASNREKNKQAPFLPNQRQRRSSPKRTERSRTATLAYTRRAADKPTPSTPQAINGASCLGN